MVTAHSRATERFDSSIQVRKDPGPASFEIFEGLLDADSYGETKALPLPLAVEEANTRPLALSPANRGVGQNSVFDTAHALQRVNEWSVTRRSR